MAGYSYNYDPNLDISFNDIYYSNFMTNQPNRQMSKSPLISNVQHNENKEDSNSSSQTNNIGFGGICLICVLVIFIIVFTVWRYGLLGKAIEKNNTLASLALLSPEIGNAVYLAFL